MNKDDYVIICGDFGYWDESKEQKYWLKWLDGKPFTTLWVDGNHENYDFFPPAYMVNPIQLILLLQLPTLCPEIRV